jgi:hypothetical protein
MSTWCAPFCLLDALNAFTSAPQLMRKIHENAEDHIRKALLSFGLRSNLTPALSRTHYERKALQLTL